VLFGRRMGNNCSRQRVRSSDLLRSLGLLCAVSAGGYSPSSNDTMLGGYVLSRTTADLNHSGADPRLPSPTSGPADCVPPRASAVEHMGVDHCRGHVAVAEQLLHRPNVVARLQQVRRERMTQYVRRARLDDLGPAGGACDRLLNRCLVHVMAPRQPAARVDRLRRTRENPLPAPGDRRHLLLALAWFFGFPLVVVPLFITGLVVTPGPASVIASLVWCVGLAGAFCSWAVKDAPAHGKPKSLAAVFTAAWFLLFVLAVFPYLFATRGFRAGALASLQLLSLCLACSIVWLAVPWAVSQFF